MVAVMKASVARRSLSPVTRVSRRAHGPSSRARAPLLSRRGPIDDRARLSMEHEWTWIRRSRLYADRLVDRPWPGILRQRAKGAIFAFFLLATPMAATAQDRPGPAAELTAGWVGFADDGIVSESLVGAAARWYLLPRVSVGPELVYIRGAHHSHLVATGNVTWDVLAPTNR